MSTSGCSAVVLAPPSAVPLSAARPRRFAPGTASRIVLTARSTLSEVRPLTITSAPSRARTRAIPRPMPPVDAVTSARWPCSCRSIVSTPVRRAHRLLYLTDFRLPPSADGGLPPIVHVHRPAPPRLTDPPHLVRRQLERSQACVVVVDVCRQHQLVCVC